MKNFVIGLLEHNRSMTTTQVRNAIKNRFEITISDTTIKDFRRENDLSWVRPKSNHILTGESGAAEIPIALALGTGLIDAITDSILWRHFEVGFQEFKSVPMNDYIAK